MERLLTLYSEVQSTDVRWLWYPFIAIGKITLLQGDPGDGKSSMMMNLIAELSKGLYRSLGSIDVVAAARSVLQVERDAENPDIRIVHQIKNSLAPTAEDIRFSISAESGFQWLECRPQLFEKQQPDTEPEFDTEQQKAVYWIKHFLEKGDMSANEMYCRLDNEGVSKRVARMVKTEMGIHCYQKKRRWYWSVQPEEGAVNGPQV